MTENWNNKSTLIPLVSLKPRPWLPDPLSASSHSARLTLHKHHISPLGHSPPLYRDTVTMTTSHLFLSSATQAQTGEVGRREGGANTPIYTLTHRQAWSGNLSLMLMQRDWYTENLLIFLLFLFLTWLSGTGVWGEGRQDAPRPPSHMINHDHNQSIHTASIFLIYS